MNRTSIMLLVAVAAIAIGGYVYKTRTVEQVRGGSPLVKVVVPAFSSLEATGEAKYDQHCASCHGKNAAGQDGVAPPFVHPIYEPGHHGDAAFYSAAKNGAQAHHWNFGNMPPVADIEDGDIGEIVAYVRALQRANGIQ